MSLPRLPDELYRPIVEDVASFSDLCSIALCARQLRCEAQRVLFREFNLTSIKQHLSFLDSVVAAPDRLALYVTVYRQDSVPRITNGVNRAQYLEEIATLVEKTRRAVPLMKNLNRLHHFPMLIQQDSSELLLRSKCRFQLDVFDWRELTSKTALMESFLPSQSQLKHIGLDWNNFFDPNIPTTVVPADLCPMLDSLHAGSWSVVQGFLPGRKVTRLTWMTGIAEPFITTPMATLSSEFRHLRYLAFDTGGPPLESISCYLESLELLELFTSASLQSFKITLQQITTIPHLRSLVLTSISGPPFGTYLKARQKRAFARTAFASLKSLQELDIEATDAMYERHQLLPLKRKERDNGVTVEEIQAERVHYWKSGVWHCKRF